jgi:23S rRNA (guanosine2251-2'-O)-methyltransferase
MVLVVGSEGQGLRALVRERCDELVAVPQAAGGVASMNASTAAAVLLYEAARQVRG